MLLVRSFENNATSFDTTGPSRSPNTAVAMIVLYAVTGCVSVLFCIIIISGAIKAIRHPERYARNHDGATGWSQSRARGLTRAILDTFPIVKFGSNTEHVPTTQMKDTKAHPDAGISLSHTSIRSPSDQSVLPGSQAGASSSPPRRSENNPRGIPRRSVDDERVTELPVISGDSPLQSALNQDSIPAAIGRETCPICIVDFEEGDDLRILPCDGAHRFHQSCVDPWLLALSTACPLCRHDFIALENMISGGSEVQDLDPTRRTSRLRRFSRYLRFARHGRTEDAARSSLSAGEDVLAVRSLSSHSSQV
ncbi:hypothetical protein B0H19DRAFT_1092851 [Mycena capillaripes]|nr:hypothetical protein B0H19DRAFT_1092851 [Mycena capillaripes]